MFINGNDLIGKYWSCKREGKKKIAKAMSLANGLGVNGEGA